MINVPMESDSEDKGDFRDTNPSTSNQSVLVSSSSEHATCIRQVSTDDILDYIGFGFFQVSWRYSNKRTSEPSDRYIFIL